MQQRGRDQKWVRPPAKAGNANTLPEIHESRLRAIQQNASQIAGTARQIELAIDELLAKGGIINVQGQIAYIVGAMMRMQKDFGVIEQLQQYGIRHKPRMINGNGNGHHR